MKRLEAEVQCRWCSHVFRVCLHRAAPPLAGEEVKVFCPSNGSIVLVSGSQFREVEQCTEGAVHLQTGWRKRLRKLFGLR